MARPKGLGLSSRVTSCEKSYVGSELDPVTRSGSIRSGAPLTSPVRPPFSQTPRVLWVAWLLVGGTLEVLLHGVSVSQKGAIWWSVVCVGSTGFELGTASGLATFDWSSWYVRV